MDPLKVIWVVIPILPLRYESLYKTSLKAKAIFWICGAVFISNPVQ